MRAVNEGPSLATPTVAHGLAANRPLEGARHRVAVASGTNPVRNVCADILEYGAASPARRLHGLGPTRVDAVAARLGRHRPALRRSSATVVRRQDSCTPSRVLAHNAHQLRLADCPRRWACLYAYIDVLTTYGRREASRMLDPAVGIVCESIHGGDVSPSAPAHARTCPNSPQRGRPTVLTRLEPLRASDNLRIAYVGRLSMASWKSPVLAR